MSVATAIASYAAASAATASPQEIVRMAYDRVLTACDRAEHARTQRPENWIQRFHDEMVRSQAILLELTSGLALAHPDDAVALLSAQLCELYRFCNAQLTTANITKSVEPLRAVRSTIGELRDAWVHSVR
jgi:flagellar biosynthetic protein FliS